MNTIATGRNGSSGDPLPVLWTNTKPVTTDVFVPNHFVPVYPKSSVHQQNLPDFFQPRKRIQTKTKIETEECKAEKLVKTEPEPYLPESSPLIEKL